MATGKTVIAGIGCSLADYLYSPVSFSSEGFRRYLSKTTGDGGLNPGHLVFTEELEAFAGKPYSLITKDFLGNRQPDAWNIGGPSVVALIHAAQMLEDDRFDVRFYGMSGKDDTARRIRDLLSQLPLDISHYLETDLHATPFTDVFSDPEYDGGHGERTFVNNIGAAGDYLPEMVDESFFGADLVCFGGTGLVPVIHDHLSPMLARAKAMGSITLVNTVYDFRNEKKHPGRPWPLVSRPEDYRLIDILAMDLTEALRISGKATLQEAAEFFTASGVSCWIITNGAQDLLAWSDGRIFGNTGRIQLPVSQSVVDELRTNPDRRGDTTGCGDNFVGGIIASVARQLAEGSSMQPDLREALSWGVASGGFCCFSIGGMFREAFPGEKREAVEAIRKQYLKQTNG